MKRILLLLTLLIACSAVSRTPRCARPDAGLHYLDSHFHLYDSLQKQIHGFAETGYNCCAATWNSRVSASNGVSPESRPLSSPPMARDAL